MSERMIQIIKELEKMGKISAKPSHEDAAIDSRHRLDWHQPDGEARMIQTDLDREEFLSRLAVRLPSYAERLGLSVDDIAAVQRDAAALRWVTDQAVLTRETARNWAACRNRLSNGSEAEEISVSNSETNFADPVAPGIFWRIRCLAHRIRNDHAYTYEIGNDLGIANVDWLDDWVAVSPRLTVRKSTLGVLEISWTLRRPFNRLRLEVDRDGRGFCFLALVAGECFVDQYLMPLSACPVTWRYRGLYGIDEDGAGRWSDSVEISIT